MKIEPINSTFSTDYFKQRFQNYWQNKNKNKNKNQTEENNHSTTTTTTTTTELSTTSNHIWYA